MFFKGKGKGTSLRAISVLHLWSRNRNFTLKSCCGLDSENLGVTRWLKAQLGILRGFAGDLGAFAHPAVQMTAFPSLSLLHWVQHWVQRCGSMCGNTGLLKYS